MIPEARLEETPTGVKPAADGWFIVNAAEIGWETTPGGGAWCTFEAPSAPSPRLGIGIHVLHPGESPGMYHREDEQEGFLVLSGECVVVVEGQERRMGPWDYFHCPPDTAHITVGAGAGPCAIVMVGTRREGKVTEYLPDDAAARLGASVTEATTDPRVAYAGRPPIVPAPSPWGEPGVAP